MSDYTYDINTTSGTSNTNFIVSGSNFIDTNTTWFPNFDLISWLPYKCEKYYPAYHLLLSYGVKPKTSFWKRLRLKIPLF